MDIVEEWIEGCYRVTTSPSHPKILQKLSFTQIKNSPKKISSFSQFFIKHINFYN